MDTDYIRDKLIMMEHLHGRNSWKLKYLRRQGLEGNQALEEYRGNDLSGVQRCNPLRQGKTKIKRHCVVNKWPLKHIPPLPPKKKKKKKRKEKSELLLNFNYIYWGGKWRRVLLLSFCLILLKQFIDIKSVFSPILFFFPPSKKVPGFRHPARPVEPMHLPSKLIVWWMTGVWRKCACLDMGQMPAWNSCRIKKLKGRVHGLPMQTSYKEEWLQFSGFW